VVQLNGAAGLRGVIETGRRAQNKRAAHRGGLNESGKIPSIKQVNTRSDGSVK